MVLLLDTSCILYMVAFDIGNKHVICTSPIMLNEYCVTHDIRFTVQTFARMFLYNIYIKL